MTEALVHVEVIAGSRAVERPGLRLAPIDWLTAAYGACAASVLLAQLRVHGSTLAPWETACLLTGHLLLFVVVMLAPRARASGRDGRSAIAEWYALIVMAALYASVGLLNHRREMLLASFDAGVQGWEMALFGRQMAFWWGRATPSVILDWIFGLCYLAFYPMVLVAPGLLWTKRQFTAARQTIFGIALAFFICYLMFILFPVAGPWYLWAWPTPTPHAPLPVAVLRRLVECGDAWGSAFPSSHVAASMTAAMLVVRSRRAAGIALLLLAAGIALAVVYCQVHYAVDAVAGLVVAGVASCAAVRCCSAGA